MSEPDAAERFYIERDRRTAEYDAGLGAALSMRVGIGVESRVAESRVGQVALLALVNMVARLHRRITVAVPTVPLLAQSLVPSTTLDEAVEQTILSIDPFNEVRVRGEGDIRGLPTVTLGDAAGDGIRIGWQGMVGTSGRCPQPVDLSDRSILGASLGACLGAGALLHLVLGGERLESRVSLADYSFGDRAFAGPDTRGPIDVGDVLVVGAGAVASALLYWLREIGVRGQWLVVDRDLLYLHNTNRTLGSLVEQTEWARREAQPKADVAAGLIGAQARMGWYHEWLGSEPKFAPDLVLPLANEHDVRRLVGLRGDAVLVHATTSPYWTAELHRHIPNLDECIECRFPATAPAPTFACSTAPVEHAPGQRTDAALPFLSAAAGLLLVRALTLQERGELDKLDTNFVRLGLGGAHPGFGQVSRLFARPRASCPHIMPDAVRAEVARARAAATGVV